VLHFPVTHDGGRLVTFVYWLVSALFAGPFVQRISNSLLLGGTALARLYYRWRILRRRTRASTTAGAASVDGCELSHSTGDLGPHDFENFLATVGAVGAALLFTKVNVGVFYTAALASALVCVIKPTWIRLLGVSLSMLYAITVPYFLMHSDFYRGVEGYCFLAILCGTSIFALGSLVRSVNPYSSRTLLYAGTGLLVTS
jgi:hypothetical protein